ncbi:HAD family hydrolase [Paraglaciecola sp.]|uniref:HAD family hydrolase n=1 Tax=Paraglaciecola sp. TaxID=1920173 RepID=UPI003262F0FD
MVDLPNQVGPMCDWPQIKVVDGALDCLKHLSLQARCHLATNAEESTEVQIRNALQRAGLSDYISQVFCRENLGVGKTDSSYYPKIISRLGVKASQVTMVGDSLERDVLAPMSAGLQGIWFNPSCQECGQDIKSVEQLTCFIS